jgi:hypothetical protein
MGATLCNRKIAQRNRAKYGGRKPLLVRFV